ncbi:MAG: aminoglycoside N(3)-acetyltransferase, partial [Solobacterium sp.]|nr:aminoglycoside N(3)-acetyltransferase [Solobacterium sp.]
MVQKLQRNTISKLMTEMKQTVSDPVTKESFIQALKSLGITGNQILEVHT